MSMYRKNNKVHDRHEILIGIFAILFILCLGITPILLCVGFLGSAPQLFQGGIITYVVGTVSGVIVWATDPERCW